MRLRVQYNGQLRTAAGRSEEHVELPESSTLAALFTHLASSIGQGALPHLLTPSRHPQSGLLIILNDSAIPIPQISTTILRDRDTITLLPPIAGG